jgi:hypothetical protein
VRRGFWFVAGAGAGVYAVLRARRAAEALSPDGLRARAAGLGGAAPPFVGGARSGMTQRETELRERLGLALHGPPELAVAPNPPERLEGTP